MNTVGIKDRKDRKVSHLKLHAIGMNERIFSTGLSLASVIFILLFFFFFIHFLCFQSKHIPWS